ncbi:Bifunctional protein GlmU [subsurface metagenome]
MKIIIPMAGIGKRMRPHTLSVPKPLLKIAGKSIVERLVEKLGDKKKNIEEIHFVIGNFGKEVEEILLKLAEVNGARGYIHYQKEALGTAHAVFSAAEALNGEVIIAFADTLFIGDFVIRDEDEAIIWTKVVKNPEKYGVVKEDSKGMIIDFIEKPENFVSNKAIIGIYYFKNAEIIKIEIDRIIKNDKKVGGEYQLTDGLRNMLAGKVRFKCKVIDEWLDCGNKDMFLKSCMRIVEIEDQKQSEYNEYGNRIVKPVYISKNTKIKNSVIGPYVCIEDNTYISDSNIENSMIGRYTVIEGSTIRNSILGNQTVILGAKGELNLGDFNRYEGK